MGLFLLLSGIAVNVSGVLLIKFAQHSSVQILSLVGYLLYFSGFVLISSSFKHLEVGTAYAVWSGLGSLLVASFGVLFFGESVSLGKVGFFSFILVGVVGLSLS